jgi:hypothetical protein
LPPRRTPEQRRQHYATSPPRSKSASPTKSSSAVPQRPRAGGNDRHGTEPVTFVAVPAVLVVTAVAAGLVPRIRANRVDPAVTRRSARNEQSIADFELLLRLGQIKSPYVVVGQSIGGILVHGYQRRLPKQVVGMVRETGCSRFMRDLLAHATTAPQIPTKLSAPFDRLSNELQPTRLWAEAQFAADYDGNRTPFLGESQRDSSWASAHSHSPRGIHWRCCHSWFSRMDGTNRRLSWRL